MEGSAIAQMDLLGGGFVRIPSAQRAALRLPVLTSALEKYCHVHDAFTPMGNIMRIIFGKRKETDVGTLQYPSLTLATASSISVASQALCAFTAGNYVSILGCKPTIRVVPQGSSGTITTPVMSVGSTAAASASATLLTTEANIFPSTAVTSLTPTVAGTFTSAATVALTDSTSGTVSRTLAAFSAVSNSATDISGIVAAANNSLASIAVMLNALLPGAGGVVLGDGSAAVTVYLNFACNSDADTKVLNLGELATPFSDAPSHLDLYYRVRTPVLPPTFSSL